MSEFSRFVSKAAEGDALTAEEAADAFAIMMSGDATPAQMGAFLMALRLRGESVDEITGAARTMRDKAATVAAPEGSVDTCGTGGDAKGTYNISTCAAFVAAGAGVPVAKHGNKSVSSKSGSADVLAALGVNLDVGPDVVASAISEAGVGFMFAPKHHAAMKHVAPVRAELGMRTIFNILGPLANPAGTRHQVIGVYSRDWLVPLAEVLRNLGSDRVWVVHGSDGLDELTTTGVTYVAELKDGKVTTFEVSPQDAGVAVSNPDDLVGGEADENADAVKGLLDGKPSAFRNIVILNAAAALVVSGKAKDLTEGAQLAADAIDTGAARKALDELVRITNA
ncbi:MAG: anthranilate phosphoribosyltransferase [Hyphomicrobiaceae bacterium]|nr:anthranilate phosphoribosyltransferase [Hyphomicrobiaceae bacterium]